MHLCLLDLLELQRIYALGEAEVTETSILFRIQENVLRLDISMNNIALVQIVNRFEDLSEDLPLNLFIFDTRVLLQIFFQGFTFAKLHLDVENFDATVIIVTELAWQKWVSTVLTYLPAVFFVNSRKEFAVLLPEQQLLIIFFI